MEIVWARRNAWAPAGTFCQDQINRCQTIRSLLYSYFRDILSTLHGAHMRAAVFLSGKVARQHAWN